MGRIGGIEIILKVITKYHFMLSNRMEMKMEERGCEVTDTSRIKSHQQIAHELLGVREEGLYIGRLDECHSQ